MTIGIAALCDYGNTIVLAVDQKFNAGFTSGESRTGKHNNFGQDWYVAYAARNVPNAFEVIMAARPMVLALDDKVWHDVVPAVENGYRKVRNAKTEALFLASWGETSKEFHATGRDRIPETIYAATQHKMANYDLDADLLVVGFDDVSHIFTIENPGVSKDHTGLGFWAIGSGAPAALASLFARKCSFHCHVEEVLYLVYEAKRQAEAASGVGTETDLFIICKNNIPIRVPDTHIAAVLDPIWDELSPRKNRQRALIESWNASSNRDAQKPA